MYKIGFIGLGRMGTNIACNINKKYDTFVWNRTLEKSKSHHKEYGTTYIENIIDIPKNTDIIFFCLPTNKEVEHIINLIKPYLNANHILIDCTSSDAISQKRIYNELIQNNIYYFDAPVSGGPEKAYNGILTCMVGGNKEKYIDIEDIFKTFSNPIYVGEIGNGCAIKSINNILNVSHLCLAAEALSALEEYGIEKKVALEVINKSSGRSLSTQERIPIHILEKNYNYGFALGLMNKDVQLALKLIKNPIMFNNISSLLKESLNKYGENADYTEIAKLFFERNN
jgi:3-hydroxyisobutyrate dehydrogenase